MKNELKYLKIDERYRFNDDDLALLGDLNEYEIIGSSYECQGNDFDVLLKHKDNEFPSLISCDEHSCIAYFYEDAEDYFNNNIKDNLYDFNISNGIDFYANKYKFEYPYYLEDTFGYKI